MNKEMEQELDDLIDLQNKSNASDNVELIKILLKELARRLLLWKKAIEENNKNIEIGTNILFDIALIVTGNRIELPPFINVSLPHFDRLILESYFNWKEKEEEIKSLGFDLENPYLPFIEIFKLGGCCLKFEYTRLEVYPFIGINVHPKEEFQSDLPFRMESR